MLKFSPDGKVLMRSARPAWRATVRTSSTRRRRSWSRRTATFLSPTATAEDQCAHREVLEGREVHQDLGQEGLGARRARYSPRARDGFARPAVRRRPQNNRIQIFDQDGKFLDQWTQFSRPSGIFIDKNDVIYVADSESESVSKNHDGWKRGIRVGSAKDGTVTAFIPDPVEKATGTSAAEGVAADAMGNIYGAEVGPKRLMKYVKN